MNNSKVKNLFEYVKNASDLFANLYGSKMSRSLNITMVAIAFSILIAIGKLVMGVLSLSLFICANAFYSFGMIGAKVIAFTGILKAQGKNKQYQYYFWSGIILIISSFVYIVYSIQLLFTEISSSYHMYVALEIALITFTEIGINIRGVIITRHDHTILVHAIKIINLSASLISLVLTQTALLSFKKKELELIGISKTSGMIGVLMGTVATLLGIYMICRISKLKKSDLIVELDK